jgi:hypothetical protein
LKSKLQVIVLFLFFLIYIIAIAQNSDAIPHGENFRLDCNVCHNTETWKVEEKRVTFDHDEVGFSLLGAHKSVTCRSCHKDLVFAHIGSACVECHTDIHRSELGFRCEECHTARSWENRRDILDKHMETNFPLVGIHALLDCQSCHDNAQSREYVNTPVECKGCHQQDYIQATNPDHKLAGFDINCEKCHLPNAPTWYQVRYIHSPSFPLSGGHASPECIDCHKNIYQTTAVDCYACHKADYEQSADPEHLIFGFPTVCEVCHTTVTWMNAGFNHIEASGFDLTGAHRNIQCTECHVNNQISGLPLTCYGCHEQDYRTAGDPDHSVNNFNHDCTECHTTFVWVPAQFDHNNSTFPLTGGHSNLQCTECHANGYTNTPAECAACHRDAYNQTSDPDHQAAQFPLLCQECHTTTGWSPASWDHDGQYFPIYSGRHREEWDVCSDCHINASNYTLFECIYCHAHTKNETDSHHREEQGYQYNSQACKTCHPRGEAEDD